VRTSTLLLPLSLAIGCASHSPQPVAPPSDPTILVPTIVQCPSTSPFEVTAKNRTPAQVDLCAAFDGAFAKAAQASGLGTEAVELEVDLTEVEVTSVVKCHLRLTPTANGKTLTLATGAAAAAPRPSEAADSPALAQDCVDVVVDNLLTSKVIPAVQRYVTQTNASGASAP
jgi:hypothetical protein